MEPGRIFEEAGPAFESFVWTFRHLIQVSSGIYHGSTEQWATELVKVGGRNTYSLAPFCALVELGTLLSDPALADSAYPVLSLAAERGVVFSSGWIYLIPRVLGVLDTLHQQWDKAEEHFQEAIAVATTSGARPELARAYLDYAWTLVARHRKIDRHRTIEFVRLAAPIFHELDMEPFLQRAIQLAESLQTSLALGSRQPRAYPDNLNVQEVAVLLHLAQGRSYQEIPDALVLGVKTIHQHVNPLFHKIGFPNSTAMTTYAFGKELVSPTASQDTLWSLTRKEHGKSAEPAQPLCVILVTDSDDFAFMTCPVALSQQTLVELPRRMAGEFAQEIDGAWTLIGS